MPTMFSTMQAMFPSFITARIITGPASEPITDSWHGQTTWENSPIRIIWQA